MVSTIKSFAFLFLISIQIAKAVSLCSTYYKDNFILVPSLSLAQKSENHLYTKIENNQSSEITIMLPENFSSSLQIEVHGEISRRYLISSLTTDSSQTLISDNLSMTKKNQYLAKALQEIDNFMSGTEGFTTSVSAYNSKIRSIPGIQPGHASVLIPAKFLKKKDGRRVLKLKIITDGSTDAHPVEIRTISSKPLVSSKQKKNLKLNLFIPEGLKDKMSKQLLEALFNKVNLIYSAASVHISVNNLSHLPSQWNSIEIDNFSSKKFYDISKNSSYGLNLVLTESLTSSMLGSLGGYSFSLVGPSSKMGVKNSGVFLEVPIFPRSDNQNEIENWSLLLANYLAHEIGHYLGLFHTYELSAVSLIDKFKDTPEVASENLMNPEAHRGQLQSLSPEQAIGIRQHPLLDDIAF